MCVQIYVKIAEQEKKSLQDAQANHLFQGISGSKAILWNFQCVKCMDKHTWNKMIEQKAGLRGRIPRKDSKRMSMPAA